MQGAKGPKGGSGRAAQRKEAEETVLVPSYNRSKDQWFYNYLGGDTATRLGLARPSAVSAASRRPTRLLQVLD